MLPIRWRAPVTDTQPAVLVIDDEAQIRRFLRAGFELAEFTVLEAENANRQLNGRP